MGSKPKYGQIEATWKENSRQKTTQLMMTFPSDMLSIDFHLKGKQGVLFGEMDVTGNHTFKFRPWGKTFKPHAKIDNLMFEQKLRIARERTNPRMLSSYYSDYIINENGELEIKQPHLRALSLRRAKPPTRLAYPLPAFRPKRRAARGEPAPKKQKVQATSSESIPDLISLPSSPLPMGLKPVVGSLKDSPGSPIEDSLLLKFAGVHIGNGEEMRVGGVFREAQMIDPIIMDTEQCKQKRQPIQPLRKAETANVKEVISIASSPEDTACAPGTSLMDRVSPDPKLEQAMMADGSPLPLEPEVQVVSPELPLQQPEEKRAISDFLGTKPKLRAFLVKFGEDQKVLEEVEAWLDMPGPYPDPEEQEKQQSAPEEDQKPNSDDDDIFELEEDDLEAKYLEEKASSTEL